MQNHILAPENFAGTFKRTISQLSADIGIDEPYLRRIGRGERVKVSREVLLLIGMAMVLDKSHMRQVIEVVNPLLDAGGYKVLRDR